MTEDIEALRFWIKVVLIICSVTTTSVPFLYAFSPWRSRIFGRLFMLQALSLAAAIDLSVVLTYWRPENILILFWIRVIMLTAIACSTLALSIMMVVIPIRSRKKAEPNDVQRQDVSGS